MAQLAKKYGLKSRDFLPRFPKHTLPYDSLFNLSVLNCSEKLEKLVSYLEKLKDGIHIIISHPAVESEELLSLCTEKWSRRQWATDIRTSDYLCLTNNKVINICKDNDIKLITSKDAIKIKS
jgi:hypothetical protein